MPRPGGGGLMGVTSEASRAGRNPAFSGFMQVGHAPEAEDIGVIKRKVRWAHFESAWGSIMLNRTRDRQNARTRSV